MTDQDAATTNSIENDSYKVVVYRYGLSNPINWDNDCQECLWQQNKLWNALVEAEHAHREQYRKLIGEHRDIEQLNAQLDPLLSEQKQLREDRTAWRKANRKKVGTPEIDKRLREIAREMQPIRDSLREVRAMVKGELAQPILDLNLQHAATVKKIHTESPLWWPNTNAVVQSFQVARGRAMKDGVMLRFHRFRGDGRFTTQIIGGTSVNALASGQCSQVRLDQSLQEVPKRKFTLPRISIALYSRHTEEGHEFRYLTFPIHYDRPLPDNARIQDVTVKRSKLGTHYEYYVVFRCRIPDFPEPIHEHPTRRVALNLGFRLRPDKSLRVAMLYDGDQHTEFTLPQNWLRRMKRVEGLATQRDHALNAITAELRAQIPDRPAWTDVQAIQPTIEQRLIALLRAPKFGAARLASIAIAWRQFDWWPQMRERVEAWRHEDKLQYNRQAFTREKALKNRRHEYRMLARKLCKEYGEIRIGHISLRWVSRLEKASGEETPLNPTARGNRQLASLYELQQQLDQQICKFGVRLIKVGGSYSSTCHTCGGRVNNDKDDLIVSCPNGHVWDIDELAARNIFAAPPESYYDNSGPEERSRLRFQALTRMKDRLKRMHAARRAKRSQGGP